MVIVIVYVMCILGPDLGWDAALSKLLLICTLTNGTPLHDPADGEVPAAAPVLFGNVASPAGYCMILVWL